MTVANVVTILGVVLGSGAFSSLANWLLKRFDRKTLTPDDLKPFDEKLDRDYRHMQVLDDSVKSMTMTVKDMRLMVLRMSLFQPVHDRNSHEAALQAGEQYITLGGNGVGHIRLNQLTDDYKRRLEDDDWTYPA